MRILITSDWQTDYENLELCSKAAEEILQLKEEHRFEVLIHAGDLKRQYNPIDVRIVNFWLKMIGKCRKAGLEVFVNLGNHDRVGMHVDTQNWLPVVRKAGAFAYDEPQLVVGSFTDRGVSIPPLAFLPFRNNPVLLKREAHDLAKKANENSILIFHCDLKNARYNVLSRSAVDLSVEDLYPDKYMFCVGGHLHFQHKVADNIWYVGSPFAMDWGEANQRKGYLLIDTLKKTIKRIRSKIPGWYDPNWPGFEESKPESWKGAKVRIKVPCDGVQHVRELLEKARVEAAKKYDGAEIVTVPEFREAERAEGKIRLGLPDEKKIRIYVQETLPDELRGYESAIKKYLVEQLSLVGGLEREHGELKFLKTRARNFLSYEKLDFIFEPGLCVIAGENKDWKGRSNGSGKTSALQPIAVTLFGQTFKGQKHDGWMRRGTDKKEEVFAKVWFQDSQGRACWVNRPRQPKESKLKLVVDGDVVESGNRPESTQKLIEQVTGYTWETLANAIYIDQSKSHLMLTGTESERKGFLAKLQNLERFERAEKSVRDQKSDFERRYELNSDRLQSVLTEEKNLLDTISRAKRILALNASVSVSYRRVKRLFLSKKAELETWEAKAEMNLTLLDKELVEIEKVDKEMTKQLASVEERLDVLRTRLSKFKRMEGVCPTCERVIDEKAIQLAIPEMEKKIRGLEKQVEGFGGLEWQRKSQRRGLENKKIKWLRNKSLAGEVSDLQVRMEKLKFEWLQYKRQQELIDGLQKQVNQCKELGSGLTRKKIKIGKWLKVLKYSQSVFQRNGLPASLNQQICPELNQAAAEYAELFAQREIQVRFAVDEEGRLDVRVINAHGGEGVADQSEGEMKMASLITSFAVRSVAPKTNILILDEPGDGLDAISARSFARGLKQVTDRFGSILLTTHNPAILSELADAKLVVVRKENGISEVVDG